MAMARSLPAWICGMDDGRLSKISSIWPPTASATAGPEPL
ncbi:Uncharacterised protein [Bordetella pertussis]|nr:Uncharacterised protein [Bordetella pertussis]